MPSVCDLKKRAFVKVLKELIRTYGVQLEVSRDTPDDAIKRAYKRLSLKVHPDHGGKSEDQQRLNDSCIAWQDAVEQERPRGRPATRPLRPSRSKDFLERQHLCGCRAS